MGDEDEEQDYFNYMLDSGVVEYDSVDSKGEINYVYNFEAMKRLHPDMYEMVMSDINESLVNLLEADMITVDYDENLTAHIKATSKGISVFNDLMGESEGEN